MVNCHKLPAGEIYDWVTEQWGEFAQYQLHIQYKTLTKKGDKRILVAVRFVWSTAHMKEMFKLLNKTMNSI